MFNTFEDIRDRILEHLDSIKSNEEVCIVQYCKDPFTDIDIIKLRVQNYVILKEQKKVTFMVNGETVQQGTLTPGYSPVDGTISNIADFTILGSKFDKLEEYVDYLQSQGKNVKLKKVDILHSIRNT
ncbi:hypothetical protein HOR18_gp174 [Staphylococcus phage vB_SscM-1]|uniref:Uncharacterized protein n=2 Tax=Sciuriunavirus SscM1 TaxID=2734053 RepID=A0A1X9I9N1_9CAUD|nr:hypothetical protein HOR18_gp174 [Staphylococcus phage vB_SscM-1]ANT44837.1 hypothetical protein vB_SscM-1_173 [Staphylococcus phage vB_SscM-1]ANT45039.1 hypothetical protein vB_SscM-2_172 [Staphylococcus phage vB_SscM-2]